jgi:hypothetical protein
VSTSAATVWFWFDCCCCCCFTSGFDAVVVVVIVVGLMALFAGVFAVAVAVIVGRLTSVGNWVDIVDVGIFRIFDGLAFVGMTCVGLLIVVALAVAAVVGFATGRAAAPVAVVVDALLAFDVVNELAIDVVFVVVDAFAFVAVVVAAAVGVGIALLVVVVDVEIVVVAGFMTLLFASGKFKFDVDQATK